jgi:hypothetical protein
MKVLDEPNLLTSVMTGIRTLSGELQLLKQRVVIVIDEVGVFGA